MLGYAEKSLAVQAQKSRAVPGKTLSGYISRESRVQRHAAVTLLPARGGLTIRWVYYIMAYRIIRYMIDYYLKLHEWLFPAAENPLPGGVFVLKCRICGRKIKKGQSLCQECIRLSDSKNDSFTTEKYTDLMNSYVSSDNKNKRITPDLLAFTTFAIAAAMLVITVILVTTGRDNIKLELSDYIVIEYNGFNGFGELDAHFDSVRFRSDCENKLPDSSSDPSGAGNKTINPSSLADLIINNVNDKYSFSKTSGLKNGDTVKLRWDISAADNSIQTLAASGISISGRNYTVEKLTDTSITDPFSDLTLSYTGFNGNGTLEFNSRYPLIYTFDKTDNLKNGDIIHVTISAPYGNDLQDYCLNTIGSVLTATESSFTVSGLPELKSFDPFSDVSVHFYGVSGEGTASSEYKGDMDLRYTLNRDEGLSEGETVTVTVEAPFGYGLNEYCEKKYGLRAETTMKQFTVTGLGTYLTKLSDIDEITMKHLFDESEKAIGQELADMQSKTEYQGMILMTLKNGQPSRNSWLTSDDQDHMLFLVYKVTAQYSSGGKNKSFTYWTSCRFNNVMKLKNGTLKVNTDDLILPVNKVTPSGSSQKLSGFNDYSSLYNSQVKSKLGFYTVQSSVKEKLSNNDNKKSSSPSH